MLIEKYNLSELLLIIYSLIITKTFVSRLYTIINKIVTE